MSRKLLGDFTTRHAASNGILGLLGVVVFLAIASGCSGGSNSIVEENDEYSYQDVAAQIAAEEAATDENE